MTTKTTPTTSPFTLTPLFRDVVRTRDLLTFLSLAVDSGIIPASFEGECIDSLKLKSVNGGVRTRQRWGSCDFDSLRSLYLHCHPKATPENRATARWIRVAIARAEDVHAGFDDVTAGCL